MHQRWWAMYGPKPSGFWTKNHGQDYRSLQVGRRYRVVRAFEDFDGVVHQAGEHWTFLGYNYLPYDAGLSLFVSLDGDHEWHIRLQCSAEEQQAIVDDLPSFIQEI